MNKFFGWENFKWLVREFRDMYSNIKSHFSKKRFESGVAFGVGQFGMIYWLVTNISTIDYIGICAWSSVEFAICGYMVNKIQKEKETEL